MTAPDPMAVAFAVAQETTRRALDRFQVPTAKPATVDDWCHDAGPAIVSLDGDEESLLVLNSTAGSLRPGDRVLVTFYPPSGAFVTGLLSTYRPPIVQQTVAAAATATATAAYTTLAFGDVLGDDEVLPVYLGGVAPQAEGRYRIEGSIEFVDSAIAAGSRLVAVRRNFVTDEVLDQRPPSTAGTNTVTTFSIERDLDQGEAIEVRARQNSGGAMNVQLVRFAMQRLGPLPSVTE